MYQAILMFQNRALCSVTMNCECKCPIPGYRFALFSSWLQVKHAAETNVSLFYWAPLDTAPRPVRARRVFKNGKVRIDAGEVTFTADDGHVDRFYRLEKKE